MKRIRKETRVGACYMATYKKALAKSVTDFYKSATELAKDTERLLLSRMAAENGHGYKVLSGTSDYLTVGWQTSEGLRVETTIAAQSEVYSSKIIVE